MKLVLTSGLVYCCFVAIGVHYGDGSRKMSEIPFKYYLGQEKLVMTLRISCREWQTLHSSGMFLIKPEMWRRIWREVSYSKYKGGVGRSCMCTCYCPYPGHSSHCTLIWPCVLLPVLPRILCSVGAGGAICADF